MFSIQRVFKSSIPFLAVAILLLACSVIGMQLPTLSLPGTLYLPLTIDLLIVTPLVYFFLVRKTKIPSTTVIPVSVVCLLIGYQILPPEGQTYLNYFKSYALPVLELSILSLIIIKVRKARRLFKQQNSTSHDFYTALRQTCMSILPPKVAGLLVTELSIVYYGLLNWSSVKSEKHTYTHHNRSGTPALLYGFLFLIAIETVALHFLLARWSNLAAWILTGLSIYTALQILGIARSLNKRFYRLDGQELVLSYGILSETSIDIATIEEIELTRTSPKNKNIQKLTPLGEVESHNILLHLSEACTLHGLYGWRKTTRLLAFYVDDPQALRQDILNQKEILT
ncbi:MAG: hypothetical protein JJ975_16920 [Bacteroidia bacterium]|nr:hypothetical protein [Bacteroidia bacterium]